VRKSAEGANKEVAARRCVEERGAIERENPVIELTGPFVTPSGAPPGWNDR
jgi:hypothetical protein